MTMGENKDYCVIMCGGIGSRFWPFSRKQQPKQFLDFLGIGRSMLQLTYDRFSKVIPRERIIIATNADYIGLVKEQLPEVDDANILAEPARRNTAPCIAWAAYHIRNLDPEANMVVTPSDHIILKEEEFRTVIRRGLDFTRDNDVLLTIGIKPNRPETGYGYIQVDEAVDDNFYTVKTFTEKPELDLAKVFIETGEFYWNSGIFFWNAATAVKAIERHQPLLATTLRFGEELRGEGEAAFIESHFPFCPNVSIDYAMMEKADNVYVQLADMGWADLGTWESLYELTPKDKNQNAILRCGTILNGCKNNIIALPEDKLAIIQDMDGYLIAEHDKVLIICKKDDETNLRKYVNEARIKLGEDLV